MRAPRIRWALVPLGVIEDGHFSAAVASRRWGDFKRQGVKFIGGIATLQRAPDVFGELALVGDQEYVGELGYVDLDRRNDARFEIDLRDV